MSKSNLIVKNCNVDLTLIVKLKRNILQIKEARIMKAPTPHHPLKLMFKKKLIYRLKK